MLLCFCVLPVSKVQVKETHCAVTDLMPNAQYELWVTATNTTGISPASEKTLYMTGNKCCSPTTTRGVIQLVALVSADISLESSLFSYFVMTPASHG